MNYVENCLRRSELKEQRKKVHLTTGLAFYLQAEETQTTGH